MIKYLILLAALIVITACSSTEEAKHNKADTSTAVTSNKAEQPQKISTNDTVEAKDSVTNINVNRQVVYIKGRIRPGQHPSFAFNVTDKDSIIANVKPAEANGNVRISQIEMPDKSFDGPFGNELLYKTKGNGRYRIILAQNMMAGDPYNGDYYLSVAVR